MIATLQGRIVAKGEDYVIVGVGGIGFKVRVPASALDRLGGRGQEVSLYTHMHVRENEISLYGCATPEELSLFELLLTVPNIGPRTAINIVSLMSAEDLRQAIAGGDASVLTRVPGVGRKTAERVMVGLKDKLGVGLEFVSVPPLTHADAEVISALTSLGYSITEAQAAIRSLPAGELTLEDKLRMALQYFGTE